MKKLDFDVFSLITPLTKPVSITPDSFPTTPVPRNYPLRLANAIRSNRFSLPQVEMLGRQMTQGPSPVRWLHFSQYEVPDYALRKVITELDESDQRAIRAYLWSNGDMRYDAESRRWVEFDPPFTLEAERAFKRVFKVLEQLAVLRLHVPQKEVEDGGPAL